MAGRALAARAARELLDQASGDRGREERFARRHDPDGGHELVGGGVLEQESAGAGAQRLVDVLVEVERGEDEDARVSPEQSTRRFQAVRSGACGRPSARRRGAAGRAASTASRPSAASPTTSRSGSDSRIMRKPARTSSWSSAIRTLIVMRAAGSDPVAAPADRVPAATLTADEGGAFAHPDQAVSARRLVRAALGRRR